MKGSAIQSETETVTVAEDYSQQVQQDSSVSCIQCSGSIYISGYIAARGGRCVSAYVPGPKVRVWMCVWGPSV